MSTEALISMAREAGGQTGWDSEQLRQDPLLSDTDFVFDMASLERFAGLVTAAERERAALVCETNAWACGGMVRDVLLSQAAAIRSGK